MEQTNPRPTLAASETMPDCDHADWRPLSRPIVLYPIAFVSLLGTALALPPVGPIVVAAATASVLAIVFLLERSHRQHLTCIGQHHVEILEEKNRWLRMTEATAHVGHWRLEFANDKVFWSDETFAIHGFPGKAGDEPPLEQAIALFHADDRDKVSEAVEHARATGEAFRFEARLMRPSGEQREVVSISQVEHDEHGEVKAVFGVLVDRTEDLALRRDLEAARDAADAAARAKSAFLAKMSHEIRTPMNGVIGFADLLLMSELDETQRRQTELIAESGKSLTLLLNDILDLSKIEAGEMAINDETVDLAHIVRQSVRLIEPEAREKGLAVDFAASAEVPQHVKIDPLRLRQILNNLLSNAVKFTDCGAIGIALDCKDDQLLIRVRDTGIGIAEDRQAAVFDPFVQAERTTSAKSGGTGLGLSISRQLSRMMGGDLTLETWIGQGSVFTVTLPARPVVPEQPASDMGKPASYPLPAGGVRVLLVEDYDINQLLVTAMAEQCGMTVELATDGIEAVEMVRKAHRSGDMYDLVLMDLQMPRMGGCEATQEIRRLGLSAEELPIIALTANAFPEDIARCKEAGMQSHLAKPIAMEAFSREIARWIGSSGTGRVDQPGTAQAA